MPAIDPRFGNTVRLIDKTGRIVADDPWVGLDDAAPLGDHPAIIVSLKRFLADRAILVAGNRRLAVRLEPNEGPEVLAPDLDRIGAVFVSFPGFRDGRGFSTARLLRSRYRFTGEIRAVGDVLRDQIFFMLRVGFDAFELTDKDPEAAFGWARESFSVVYQPAGDFAAPAFQRRARAASQGESA